MARPRRPRPRSRPPPNAKPWFDGVFAPPNPGLKGFEGARRVRWGRHRTTASPAARPVTRQNYHPITNQAPALPHCPPAHPASQPAASDVHRCCSSARRYSINVPAMSQAQHQITIVVSGSVPPAASRGQRCCHVMTSPSHREPGAARQQHRGANDAATAPAADRHATPAHRTARRTARRTGTPPRHAAPTHRRPTAGTLPRPRRTDPTARPPPRPRRPKPRRPKPHRTDPTAPAAGRSARNRSIIGSVVPLDCLNVTNR